MGRNFRPFASIIFIEKILIGGSWTCAYMSPKEGKDSRESLFLLSLRGGFEPAKNKTW